MGIPQILKTDNAPGYTGTSFASFCATFHITHLTGIPYNPQGQGIVERAHLTLKLTLLKIQKGEYTKTPHALLNHALFILNFLTVDRAGNTAFERLMATSTAQGASAQVLWKDPLTNIWNGPDSVLIWGRGHVCVFPRSADSPRWLPERLVKQIDDKKDPTADSEDAAPLAECEDCPRDGSQEKRSEKEASSTKDSTK